MKRLALMAVIATVVVGLAAPAFAARSGKAVKVGRTPKLDVALRLMKQTPPALGVEREQPVARFPESLLDRPPVVTERPATMRGFTQGMTPTVKNSFGGYDSDDNAALFSTRFAPPDVEGDVGDEYYVQWNNIGWKYWDKATKMENGPFPGNSFWVGHGDSCETENDGDPIVLYDHFADRWVFTQFEIGPGFACFAISDSNDPTGPYTTYSFPVSIAGFNDYPKMGLFYNADGSQSGYHMTTNEFNGGFLGVNVTVFDRDAILAGDPAATFVQETLNTGSEFSLQPAHLDGGSDPAPAGDCANYIQVFDDDIWGTGSGDDGYAMWEVCAEFDPDDITVTTKPFLTASAEFDGELCTFGAGVPQPNGVFLDTLGQFTMYRF